MKTLVSNERVGYSSETLEHGNKKFKIEVSNGNSYSRLNIYVYTSDNGLCQIANAYDIPNYAHMEYVWDDGKRLTAQRANINAAKKYIDALKY